MEIAYWVNSAFPLPENHFYNPDESEEETIMLLTSDEISKELALYCIENFKDDLPLFINDDTWKAYLRDVDFLLRFWKKNQYHAKYKITISS
ncbi:MAG: hypothetical protein AAF600_07470 [Bacteroidota bacterium]